MLQRNFRRLAVQEGRIITAAVGHTQLGSYSTNEKEEIKHRDSPDMGTIMQEGSEMKAEDATQAGYERARERGEEMTHAEGITGKVKATGGTIGDVASGFRQVAQKTAEMAEEAAGRATETARGMFTSSEKGDSSDTNSRSDATEEPEGKSSEQGKNFVHDHCHRFRPDSHASPLMEENPGAPLGQRLVLKEKIFDH